jgi:hypothetical protein
MDSFDDVVLNSFPDLFPFKLCGLKNVSISFFPKMLENETRKEFPYAVEYGREKCCISPSFYSIFDAFSIVIHCKHDNFTLVPYLRTIGVELKEMILIFGFPKAKWEDGRTYKASHHKIIPAKDANFRSKLSLPYFHPDLLPWEKLEGCLETIIFWDSEDSPRCVPPL